MYNGGYFPNLYAYYNPFLIASNVPNTQLGYRNNLGIYNIGVGPYGGFAGAGVFGGTAYGPGSYAMVRNPFGTIAHFAGGPSNYNYGFFSA